jgi:hypothetical protein
MSNEDRKVEWDGEGLPPVGARVKFPTGVGVVMLPPDTNEVVIVAVTEDNQGGKEYCGEYRRVSACACEPIRSEREKAVAAMVAVTDEHLSPEDTCRALYRAGYRKQ